MTQINVKIDGKGYFRAYESDGEGYKGIWVEFIPFGDVNDPPKLLFEFQDGMENPEVRIWEKPTEDATEDIEIDLKEWMR